MSDQLYCPECADKWSGAYNTDHRCVTCGSPLKAEAGAVDDELERVRAERDALAAHVDRLREALSQSLTAWGYEASQGDGIMEEHGSVYEECNKRCDEPAATSLARLKAQWKEISVRLYNSGYMAGHHDTVEGCFTDIHSSDMDSYHEDEVDEILSDDVEYRPSPSVDRIKRLWQAEAVEHANTLGNDYDRECYISELRHQSPEDS